MPGFPDDLARAVFIKLREFGTRAFPLHVSLYQEPLFSLTPNAWKVGSCANKHECEKCVMQAALNLNVH